MRLLNFCLAFVLCSLAAAEYSSLVELLLATPECAVCSFFEDSFRRHDCRTDHHQRSCSLPTVSGLTCKPTTVPQWAACMCPNIPARRRLSACAQERCSYKDVLLASKPASEYCAPYPVPSRGEELKRAVIILLAVTTPFILLRIWSRGIIMRVMWWDDYLLASAFVVHIAWLSLNIPMVDLGYGKHLWDVNPKNSISLSQMFFAVQLFYIYVQFVTKLSILVCYLRIFPQRAFRLCAMGTFVFVLLKGTAYMFVIVFRCWPIAASWDRNINGKCLNGTTYVYVAAIFSIVEDLWILVLPIPVLRSLKIPRGKKIGLGAMFGVGIIACVTSMVRVKYVRSFGDPVDPSWDNIDTSLWSLIENSVAVICASLPALRPLLSRFMPGLFGTLSANHRSKGSYAYNIHDSTSKRSARRTAESADELELYSATRTNRDSAGNLDIISRNAEATHQNGKSGEVDGDQTSGSSFNFALEENHSGIRMEKTFEINVTKPEEGYIRPDQRLRC